MAALAPNPRFSSLSSANQMLAGGKLYTYLTGSSTPAATYSNRAASVANANPVILDARGEAVVYLATGVVYRFVLKDAADNTIWTQDDVTALVGDADSVGFADSLSATYAKTLSDIANGAEVSLHRFIDPTKQRAIREFTSSYDATADIQDALDSDARAIFIPAGLHRYAGAMARATGQGLKLRGSGSGQTIIRCMAAGGLTFGESGEFNFGMPRFELEGIRLEAGVANAGTAVRINNTGGTGYAGVGAFWQDVEIVPSAPGTWWNKGVHATNLRNTRFSRVVIGSNTMVGEMTHCFHLDGTADPVEVWFDGFTYLYVAERGIYCEGAYEGIYLHGINMTSVQEGLIVRPSTAAEPVVHVLDSYINCRRAAVDLEKIAYFNVANNGISSVGTQGSGSFYALKTSSTGTLNTSSFHNNNVIGGNGYTGGTTENGVLVTNGRSIGVTHNRFYVLNKGVEFVAGDNLFERDNEYVACTTPVIKPAAISKSAARPEVLLRVNGATNAQSVAVNTATKLTYAAVEADLYAYYDSTNHRWTPPQGYHPMTAACAFTTNIADGDILNMEIRKNGTAVHTSITVAARAGLLAGKVDAVLEANGTDYFEVWVVIEGSGSNRVRSTSIPLNYWHSMTA